jgi:hypothetical protein
MGFEEFVGIEQLKSEQLDQLNLFQRWADGSNWSSFHDSHYDWWAFPIDKPSGKGFRYSVSTEVIHDLLLDDRFIDQLRKCSTLLLLSWGWDSEAQKLVDSPEEGQGWAMWPVRLYKCNRSLRLFEQTDLVESTQAYTKHLIQLGIPLVYDGRDLSDEILREGL